MANGTAGNDTYTGTSGNDVYNGLAGNDTIYGLGGNDTLDGGTGADTMIGGDGNDVYIVDNIGDVVIENGGFSPDVAPSGGGIDLIKSSVTHTLEAYVENLTLTGSAAINGYGNNLNNTLTGNSADNILDGGAGVDTMIGGAGNDTYYVDNTYDVIIDSSGAHDQVFSSAGYYTLSAGIEQGTLLNGAVGLIGNTGVNTLVGNSGSNYLDGGAGADTLIGGAGDDFYGIDNAGDKVVENANEGIDTIYSSVTYTLGANLENLLLMGNANLNGTGNSLDNGIVGNNGNNTLTGLAGDDTLDGSLGADRMIGGIGNDTYYVDNVGDVIVENANEGTDTVFSSISYTLGANLENLTLLEGGNINATGNTLANILTGNSGDNTLNGGAGADTLVGGDGNDTYVIDNAGDTITENSGEGTDTVLSSVSHTLEANVENLTLTGTDFINGLGNTLNNVIIGNAGENLLSGDAGDDTLDGGAGADILLGGTGNDVYIVDNTGDIVSEGTNEGTDTVKASISYILGANLENLTLTGTADINGTGNELDNVLTGNAGNNTLDGGTGNDTMAGGAGNDTYIVDSTGDVVTEDANGGSDRVIASVDYALGANVENLTLTGTAVFGTGNELNNNILGNAADNTLDGGAGNDILVGGSGNDVYIVDSSSDVIIETSGGGTDSVFSTASYTLSANVENLTLMGTGSINGTGNGADNAITGNSGSNTLDGGTGNDVLIGNGGNDTFVIDSAGDTFTGGTGVDTVLSGITLDLSTHTEIENATLTGTGNNNLTGNALNNVLIGNSGDNTLDGGAGADSMAGGSGNDHYIVDNTGDIVTENANGGTDDVSSSVTYTIGTNIENLTLTGSGNINGTGNDSANIITGNSGDNTLDGGAGADSLIGGGGNDTFIVDNINDIVTGGAGTDHVISSVSFTLGANLENLTLTGSSNLSGTGNALDNTIVGNSGSNTLDGGVGADTLDGSAGHDNVFIVDNANDIVIGSNANGSFDTVQSSVSWDLSVHSTNIANITLTGNADINATGDGNFNNLIGNSGDNTLDGGNGPDNMAGGDGNDTYIVDDAEDAVIENEDAGIDTVISGVNYTLGQNLENLTLTGDANTGYGNELNNIITGNNSAEFNSLDGGAGADTMIGGSGGDNIFSVDNAGDHVQGTTAAYVDTVNATISYDMSGDANLDNLNLTVLSENTVVGTGNAGDNSITVTGDGNATLLGGGGVDTLTNITAGEANVTLDGGTGADIMSGHFEGEDVNTTYIVDNAGDSVIGGAGTDNVISSVSFTLDAQSENLTLSDANTSGTLTATGNALDNEITGAAHGTETVSLSGLGGHDLLTVSAASSGSTMTLDGGTGADVLDGSAASSGSNITYIVDNAGDSVIGGAGTDTVVSSVNYTLGNNLENLTLTGSATTGTGNSLNNIITGNTGGGDNTLDGGAGADTMIGGTGNNDFYVDNGGDVIQGASVSGTDTVHSTVSFDMSGNANLDNLVLTAAPESSIDGYGNALANHISVSGSDIEAFVYGFGGDDTLVTTATGESTIYLNGGTGADTMDASGAGDETTIEFSVDNVNDVVIAGAGYNAVSSSVSYTLSTGVQELSIYDGSASGNLVGTGNEIGNTMYIGLEGTETGTLLGGGGNDTLQASLVYAGNNVTLDGGTGADYMSAANAASGAHISYIVDNTGDSVIGGAGVDSVYSSVSYTIGGNVDNLTLTGTDAINGTGNSLANTITGNSGNNTLDGGAGADTLIGGGGNDSYIVDNAGDSVIGGSGTDTVFSSISFDLSSHAANVENITLTGSSNLNATGDAGDNVLTGNSGANVLTGGDGDDTYYVGAGDTVVENMNEGTDTVISSVNFNLATSGANVENLTLTGTATSGIGNALDNTITGNDLGNTLDGGAGDDRLIGGSGNDTFIVDSSDDIVTGGNGTDTVQSSVTYSLASFADVENLTLTGGADLNATGNDGVNILTGNSGANTLDGGAGADTMIGGAGDDDYIVDNIGDVVTEGSLGGTDTVHASLSYALGANVENLVLTGGFGTYVGTGNDSNNVMTAAGGFVNMTLLGGAGSDTLYNTAAVDTVTLDGGTGADTMDGSGAGANSATTYIVDNAGDLVIGSASNIDTVVSSSSYVLTDANIDNLTLTGTAISGTGNAGVNVLTGNDGNNQLDGGAGADTMIGGKGNDTYFVDDAGDVVTELAGQGTDTVSTSLDTYTLSANVENLFMTGTRDAAAFGNTGSNNITTGIGNDTLDGGAGADALSGGAGNDTYYVDNAGDQVFENVSAGTDTVIASISFALSANVENLTLASGAGNINGTGNELANILTGNQGNNTLDGGLGSDTLIGGVGNDTYVVDSPSDVVIENADEGTDTVLAGFSYILGANLENLTLTGTADINATGNDGVNILTGNSGSNTLDGGLGADAMIGGSGNDTYIVDNAGDVITESVNGGVDTVLTASSYVLGANIENLTLTGTALSGTGNALVNVITGNDSNNTLDGAAGADTMIGGLGDDLYLVDNAGDKVIENPGEGTDMVVSTATYTLGANVENLMLIGTAAINGTGNTLDNIIFGNGAANTLYGLDGNDTLNGGAGNDLMVGGNGDDTYYVDSVSDRITEGTGIGSGIDTVFSTITYTLSANLENLTLMGVANINGFGNASDNILVGNDGNNTLSGLLGADTMIGGLGNDTYIVDNVNDVVSETGAAGTDTIMSSISFDLSAHGANVENLTLTGSAAINATGNDLNNILTGNASANSLDGGLGADTMIGGAGNDHYFVDNAGDVIIDTSGIDTVHASISYTLGSTLENLVLFGSGNMDGVGNALSNTITGNDFDNSLSGLAGNDTLYGGFGDDHLFGGLGNDRLFGGVDNDILDGGAGADTLTGGGGVDTFVFHAADATSAANADHITDFVGGNGATHSVIDISDILVGYSGGSLNDYVHLTVSGNNTIISVDADGAAHGAHFVNIVTLDNVHNLTDADALVAAHNLIVNTPI